MSSNHDADPPTAEEMDLLPILIIPGFMSSGLEITQSELRPEWEGRRLWINLSSLGFQSIHFGASVRSASAATDENEPDTKHIEYKSDWLNHMSLQHDLTSERDGVTVRAIDGLAGVDYLTPGALTNHVSYVFGPVIEALVAAGYKEEKNLDAMSYDWRLPPPAMEARDQYFTRTIERVEKMYNDNDQTPVVIMCHSLGTKVGHYFLNFALDAKGQDWLDKYIHTYMPVGGAHLGAPKALRSAVVGEKMGLDTFLTDTEALAFGRSLGSGPWLFPRSLPPGAPSPFYYRPEGVLEVTVSSPINAKEMMKNRRSISKSKKFKLSMSYNNNVVTTDFHDSEDGTVQFPEVFTFATGPGGPATEEGSNDLLQVLLLEPGTSAAKQTKSKRNWFCTIVCLPIQCLWILITIPCQVVMHVTILSAEAVAQAVGASSVFAASKPIKVHEVIKERTNDIEVELYNSDEDQDEKGGCCYSSNRPSPELITLTITWKMPDGNYKPRRGSIIAQRASDTKDPVLENARPCGDLLEKEGLADILSIISDVYDTDPVDPRGRSSSEAPPVKRVKAIYGINLPTEVGCVYRRRPAVIESETANLYELDKAAKLSKQTKEEQGQKLKGGILFETKKSKQPDGRYCSGDATVPYYSLAHVKTWKDDCQVEVSEIDKADHREILADPRFHEIVIDYVSSPKGNSNGNTPGSG